MWKATIAVFFKEKSNIIGLSLAFLLAFITIPGNFHGGIVPLTPSPAGSEWFSLDPSWRVAMGFANLRHLTWGTDFAFTYGPLGFFCTRLCWGASKWPLFLLDLFVFINFLLIPFIAFRQSANKVITALLILSIIIILPAWLGASMALVLMGFTVFWIRISMDNPKPFYFIFQIIIVTLLFFIKFNTGLIVFPLFFSGLVYSAISKKVKILYLISYAVMPIALIAILAAQLNVALLPYIKSGMQMVTGYNDVMYLPNQIVGSRNYFWAIAILLTATIVLNIFSDSKKEYFKKLVILFLFGTSLFVLYKQAFVRADVGHLVDFFIYIPLLILCIPDLYRRVRPIASKFIFITALFVPFYFLFAKQDLPMYFANKFSKANYITGFTEFTPESGIDFIGKGSQLPESVKAKIGNKTVDVFPWNIHMLFENNLNYLPRPVCQSYTAYTPYLENQNFEHYNTMTAPEFVIYEFITIDGRYPLFDESKMSLVLYSNYEVAELFDFEGRKLLLLQKKKDFRPIRLTKMKEYAMALNSPLVPQKGIYYEVGIYNNLIGKFLGIYEHAPEVRMEIQVKNGQKIEYRTSKLLLETGLFSDVFIGNTEDSSLFFSHQPGNKEVRYYNFKVYQPFLFGDKIKITEYKITQ